MKYKLKVIVLKNCPYSIAALELLTNYKIPYSKIEVTQTNKHKYKTAQISTFPQIYIINKSDELLLGGYSDIEEIINIINPMDSNLKDCNQNDNNPMDCNLDIIKKKLKIKYSINDKLILRIIEIFVSKLI
jgi:glutaredoxin